jgi:hypothetical protein
VKSPRLRGNPRFASCSEFLYPCFSPFYPAEKMYISLFDSCKNMIDITLHISLLDMRLIFHQHPHACVHSSLCVYRTDFIWTFAAKGGATFSSCAMETHFSIVVNKSRGNGHENQKIEE